MGKPFALPEVIRTVYHGHTIGVVIPAHNEALAIGSVVRGVRSLPDALVDRVVVCDNASTDATAAHARRAGAEVVFESRKGYGAACQRAVAELADVDCLVFMDGDGANDPEELTRLLAAWQAGADLVVGSRRRGNAARGSLTWLQRHGNRFAAGLLSRVFTAPVTDLGPYRAIAPQTLATLHMKAPAYGWTIEMQAKALLSGLRVEEVPVSNAVRVGHSKVSGTWRGKAGASLTILALLAVFSARACASRLARAAIMACRSVGGASPAPSNPGPQPPGKRTTS